MQKHLNNCFHIEPTMQDKTIIGLIEKIEVIGKKRKKIELLARIDTGATKSSIDKKIAMELELGPVIKTKLIKSAHGHSFRPVINVNIVMEGKKMRGEFSLADRKHMKYKVLLGQNILRNGFLIDPMKK
jgi:hypothetical protein